MLLPWRQRLAGPHWVLLLHGLPALEPLPQTLFGIIWIPSALCCPGCNWARPALRMRRFRMTTPLAYTLSTPLWVMLRPSIVIPGLDAGPSIVVLGGMLRLVLAESVPPPPGISKVMWPLPLARASASAARSEPDPLSARFVTRYGVRALVPGACAPNPTEGG